MNHHLFFTFSLAMEVVVVVERLFLNFPEKMPSFCFVLPFEADAKLLFVSRRRMVTLLQKKRFVMCVFLHCRVASQLVTH